MNTPENYTYDADRAKEAIAALNALNDAERTKGIYLECVENVAARYADFQLNTLAERKSPAVVMNHEADLTFLGVQKRDMDTVLKSVITLLFNRILMGGSEETLELEREKTSGQVGSILPRG